MRRRVTWGLALLRVTGVGALALVLWNPAVARVEPADAPPLVLLDASLSLAGHGGQWRHARDTARALARGGVIWRFGARVTGFDTLPPADGASRLAPALAAAAARGGPVTVVTDGAITDVADLPPDLAHNARVVVLPRAAFFDAFVAAVDGPRHVAASDTVRLTVSYGVAGQRLRGRDPARATLTVHLAGHRIAARPVTLPDSGIVVTELTFPVAHFATGWAALEVRLEGVPDSEPHDDARSFLLEVSPQPSVVLLAAPPDWESRFLARALTDVARVPLRTLVAAEPGGARWRDATTLAPVAPADVRQAVAAARLVIEAGDPATFARFDPRGALLVWPLAQRQEGDWYVDPPGPSPLAGALTGVAWDSLPPATWLSGLTPDPAATVALTARLARRGAPHPVVVLSEQGGTRRAAIAGGGLYRWAFRGGASGEAYRALVAGLTDWLLASGAAATDDVVPVAREVPNGMAVVWRWAGAGTPRPVALKLVGPGGARVDTLRFDADGRAELRLPPGVYRYAPAAGRPEPRSVRAAGLVAVDTYSDEWRPSRPVLAPQPGAPTARQVNVGLRERWWLFLVAVAAFAAEWAWRRVLGLP